jgi:hypothetical protein
MSDTYQITYLTNENTALTWWTSLPSDYMANCVWSDGSLREPEKLGNFNPQYGIEWRVTAKGHSKGIVSVNSWRPKKSLSESWRIDIRWCKDKEGNENVCEITALAIEKILLFLGSEKYNPKKQ